MKRIMIPVIALIIMLLSIGGCYPWWYGPGGHGGNGGHGGYEGHSGHGGHGGHGGGR
jgi:hypothetical protein